MGTLSDDLKRMGYEPTEKESPFAEGALLWSNGVELVCEETAAVIDTTKQREYGGGPETARERDYFRYPNSNRVRMPGGFFSVYEWGYDEGDFFYSKEK